jgi:putative pyruvate formate lyase activating enzyme
VLPEDAAGTTAVLRFLASEISRDCYVNLLDQYRPMYHAWEHPELGRRITTEEFAQACTVARELGLHRGFP